MSRTIIVERDAQAPMRDGVILRADVYRPEPSEPLPVLLQRTPYGKTFANPAFALMAAERGYAVVIQDTRGRWASDGDGYPFVHEMADGYDSVEWVAHQPWANGKVGMYGGSYVGYTQLAAAVTRPPALKAIAPAITFCDPYDVCYLNGAFALGAVMSWTIGAQASMAILRSTATDSDKAQLMAQLVALADGMAQGQTMRHLPMAICRSWADTASRRSCGTQPASLATAIRSGSGSTAGTKMLSVPALHIGGWYDIFAESTLAISPR